MVLGVYLVIMPIGLMRRLFSDGRSKKPETVLLNCVFDGEDYGLIQYCACQLHCTSCPMTFMP
jgi:hypothetical protein